MAGKGLAGDAAYLQGKPCPRCAYVRTPANTGEEWQCPKCHVAYAKTGIAPSVRLPVPIVTEESETDGSVDSSLVVLLAANVAAIVLAVLFRMSSQQLVLVYLAQGVIIGLANVVRMLNLHRFENTASSMDVSPDPLLKKWAYVLLFITGYGFLHFEAIFVIVRDAEMLAEMHRSAPPRLDLAFWLCTLVFACTHAYSLWHNIRADCRGTPMIEKMAAIPFVRAIPMLIAPFMAIGVQSTAALIVFGCFKTGADCVMHRMTHGILRRVNRPLIG